MTEKGLKFLCDIRSAIELIGEFTSTTPTFSDYVNDLKTRSAVERQLSIIGEAVGKFNALGLGQSLTHGHQIAGLRNRIIHAYDAIDQSIIWAILKNHLPALMDETKSLMRN